MFLVSLFLFIFSAFGYDPVDLAITESVNVVIEEQYKIEQIEISGNWKTKEAVLLKFLGLNPKKSYSMQEISSRVNFLQSLSSIYRSEFTLTQSSEGYILRINVVEQKTLLPIINFGFQRSNQWAQVGLVDLNLQGSGDELLIYYQNNQGNHGGEVFYKKNRIAGKPINLSSNFLRWSSVEPVKFDNETPFDYDFTLNQISIGVEYLYSNQVSFSAGISGLKENYQSYSEDVPGPISLDLRKALAKWQFNFSNIKYDGIYKDNFIASLTFQNIYTIEFDQFFNLLQANIRYYKRFRKVSEFAAQINAGISSNFESPFAPFVIDSYTNVRASGDRVLRGTGIVSMNYEWREELFKHKKIIAQGVAFVDAVSLRLPGTNIRWGIYNFNYFVSTGAGLRFHYTKINNAIFRVDYGYEITRNSSQILLGIGQYF